MLIQTCKNYLPFDPRQLHRVAVAVSPLNLIKSVLNSPLYWKLCPLASVLPWRFTLARLCKHTTICLLTWARYNRVAFLRFALQSAKNNISHGKYVLQWTRMGERLKCWVFMVFVLYGDDFGELLYFLITIVNTCWKNIFKHFVYLSIRFLFIYFRELIPY